jgi:hypothetical protein
MHYTFATIFRAVYDKALAKYAAGARTAADLFSPHETAWLTANGFTAQHFFDYAEDHHAGGEPGYDNALAIECVRRDYFINVQHGTPSRVRLDPASLPDREANVAGITWLPRLLPKARAKLRGELPPELMYGCGGDRGFFKRHDILPAEFLSLIWRHQDDDQAIIDWVAQRSTARPT